MASQWTPQLRALRARTAKRCEHRGDARGERPGAGRDGAAPEDGLRRETDTAPGCPGEGTRTAARDREHPGAGAGGKVKSHSLCPVLAKPPPLGCAPRFVSTLRRLSADGSRGTPLESSTGSPQPPSPGLPAYLRDRVTATSPPPHLRTRGKGGGPSGPPPSHPGGGEFTHLSAVRSSQIQLRFSPPAAPSLLTPPGPPAIPPPQRQGRRKEEPRAS